MTLIRTGLALSALLLASVTGYAQTAAPPGQALNYMNLTRGGNPAVNYYGLVRPNNMTRNALSNISQDLDAVRRRSAAAEAGPGASGVSPTGHAATFMYFGRYYPGLGAGARSGAPGQRR